MNSTRCGSPLYSRSPCSIGASGQPSAVASASAASAFAALWRPRTRNASAGIRRCTWSSSGASPRFLEPSSLSCARTSHAMPCSTTRPKSPGRCGASSPKRITLRGLRLRRARLAGRLGRRGLGHHRRHRRVVAVDHHHGVLAEHARLGRGVGLHLAVPIEMVLREVEHRRNARLEALHGVELEARQLEHPHVGQVAEHRLVVEHLREGRKQGRPDVAGHRDMPAGALDQLRGHRGRRRLAVGAGDRHHLRRVAALGLQIGERAHVQVELAVHGDARLRRGGDERRDALVARRESRAFQHELHAGQRIGVERPADPLGRRHLLGERLRLRRLPRANPTRAPARRNARTSAPSQAPIRRGRARAR